MISVCIATYNGEKYILEQLNSILPQLSASDEVIISDDHSTDNTIKLIKNLKDPRIKIYLHDSESFKFTIDRSTHNFENAIKHAHGDKIFLSDQDDKWVDNKIEMMLPLLNEYDTAVSDCYVVDENLNITCKSYFSIRKKTYNIWSTFWKSPFLGSCMAFDRKVLTDVLPFPQYGVGHDLWIALVSLKKHSLCYIDAPLSYYRRHLGTVTGSGKNNHTSLLFKISYRYYILKNMLKRLY